MVWIPHQVIASCFCLVGEEFASTEGCKNRVSRFLVNIGHSISEAQWLYLPNGKKLSTGRQVNAGPFSPVFIRWIISMSPFILYTSSFHRLIYSPLSMRIKPFSWKLPAPSHQMLPLSMTPGRTSEREWWGLVELDLCLPGEDFTFSEFQNFQSYVRQQWCESWVANAMTIFLVTGDFLSCPHLSNLEKIEFTARLLRSMVDINNYTFS